MVATRIRNANVRTGAARGIMRMRSPSITWIIILGCNRGVPNVADEIIPFMESECTSFYPYRLYRFF